MDERIVGENIRAIRVAHKTSLTEVAKRAGLTKSTLSKIENGQSSSPISTLLVIATALEVPLGDFFREEEPAASHVLTRKNQGKRIIRDGSHLGYSYEALAAGFPGKRVEPFLLTLSPADKEGDFRHGGQEFIYMLSGTIEFTVGAEKLVLRPGDSLYFDPTVIHRLKLLGARPARFLSLFIKT